MKNRRKYVGIAIMLLMVLSLGIPMLNVVTSAPIIDEPFAVINTAQDGAWNAGATWVGGTPPATGDDAVILNTHDITLPANTLTGSCEVQTGGTLDGGDGYVLTCDDENGAGFTFDNDGTISSLSLTFTYAGATDVDLNGAIAGNPTNVVCNHADLNVTQTTSATMTTFTITAGSWDCNDEALTVTGAVNVDDELCGGDSLIKIGGDADFTGGTLYYETCTVQITSSMSLTQDDENFWDTIIDTGVTVTLVDSTIIQNTLTIAGTGTLAGAQSVYVPYTQAPTQGIFCSATADFGNCPILVQSNGATKIDGCPNYNDVTIVGAGNWTVALTNRSISCVDFTMSQATIHSEVTFDTVTFDFYSSGDFLINNVGSLKHNIFDCQSNNIIFGISVIIATNGNLTSDSTTAFIQGDWTTTSASDIEWATSNTTINGTAQQTITNGAFPFSNLTINNTHASQSVIFSGDLDVDGNLTFTDGQVDFDTNNPDIDTARNVTISNITVITHGTGTWYFDGDTNFTEDNATAQNIGDILLTGTLTALSDLHTENITVNTTGFLDLSTNPIVTTDGNITFNTTASVTVGTSMWNYNGTIGQFITCNGHEFYWVNVRNTDGLITFQNVTNISIAKWFPGTTIVLNDNMTIGRLITVGTIGNRINISSGNLLIARYIYNPWENRSFDLTDLNSVIMVPASMTPGGGATSDPDPWVPPPAGDDDDGDDTDGGVCGSGFILLGIAVGTGALGIFKILDPRRKEE